MRLENSYFLSWIICWQRRFLLSFMWYWVRFSNKSLSIIFRTNQLFFPFGFFGQSWVITHNLENYINIYLYIYENILHRQCMAEINNKHDTVLLNGQLRKLKEGNGLNYEIEICALKRKAHTAWFRASYTWVFFIYCGKLPSNQNQLTTSQW